MIAKDLKKAFNELKIDETEEKIIFEEENKGGYKLQLIAKLRGYNASNILYVIRIRQPVEMIGDDVCIEYVTSVDGFKAFGELCLALSRIVKHPMFVNESNIEKIKELLTSDNIKAHAELLKISKIPGEKKV